MRNDFQHAFAFRPLGASMLRPGEIVLDFFAGGGGASEALRQALGRDPDVAVNHDPLALGMHAANHPFARHLPADVWTVDVLREVAGRRVGWFHASPDCTHFSQAKGGQPRSRATRSLSWVVLKVSGTLARRGLAPRIISLENVRQIQGWGPLVAKRDKATGRVLRLDGTVAARGERVPLREQFLVPDKRRAGHTWRQFIAGLRALGYAVEWRTLRACDYGAGTSRERLFLIARRDGEAIQWPQPTHGPGRAHPYVTAADCIDWTIPCSSIFARKKPLADATLRRIARGIQRYVIDAAEPFIIPTDSGVRHVKRRGTEAATTRLRRGRRTAFETFTATNRTNQTRSSARELPNDAAGDGRLGSHASCGGTRIQGSEGRSRARVTAPFVTEHANASRAAAWCADEPLRTQCAAVKGGHFALAVATLIQAGYGERVGQAPRALDVQSPLGTIVGGGRKHALVTAFLEQANGGGPNGNPARARGADEPVSAITATGSQQRIVTAHLVTNTSGHPGARADAQVPTITAAGNQAVVQCTLSPEHEAGALRVAAFLVKYYGTALGVDIAEPLDTVTTRDRIALVTVTVRGTPYVIVDIGLRMLKPRELYRAQGFPPDYIIERTARGKPLTISAQVRMVGNSVSPPPLAALARANLDPAREPERIAA